MEQVGVFEARYAPGLGARYAVASWIVSVVILVVGIAATVTAFDSNPTWWVIVVCVVVFGFLLLLTVFAALDSVTKWGADDRLALRVDAEGITLGRVGLLRWDEITAVRVVDTGGVHGNTGRRAFERITGSSTHRFVTVWVTDDSDVIARTASRARAARHLHALDGHHGFDGVWGQGLDASTWSAAVRSLAVAGAVHGIPIHGVPPTAPAEETALPAPVEPGSPETFEPVVELTNEFQTSESLFEYRGRRYPARSIGDDYVWILVEGERTRELFPEALDLGEAIDRPWVKLRYSALDAAFRKRVSGRYRGVPVQVGQLIEGGPARGRVRLFYDGGDETEAVAAGLHGNQRDGWETSADPADVQVERVETTQYPLSAVPNPRFDGMHHTAAACLGPWHDARSVKLVDDRGRESGLSRCVACGTLWEVDERNTRRLTPAEAERLFPEAFDGT